MQVKSEMKTHTYVLSLGVSLDDFIFSKHSSLGTFYFLLFPSALHYFLIAISFP